MSEVLKLNLNFLVLGDELPLLFINGLSLFDVLLELVVVHGESPHIETFIVILEVSSDLSHELLFSLLDGFNFFSIFWLHDESDVLFPSLNDVLEFVHKILVQILDMSFECLVLGHEFLPMFVLGFSISNDFLSLVVVHMEVPHFKTLVFELETILDLFLNSLMSSDLLITFGFVFWVIEELSVLLNSHGDLLNLVGEIMLEVLKLGLNCLVLGDESPLLLIDILSLFDVLLEIIVFHTDSPHIETFIVPLEVLLDLLVQSFVLFADGLKLSFIFWVAHNLGSLHKSLTNISKFDHDVVLEILEFSLNLLVSSNEFLDVTTFTPNLFVISSMLLVLIVVHVEFPHLETLVIELEIFLESSIKSSAFLSNSLELSFIFWVAEHLCGLSTSSSDLLELVVEILSEIHELSMDFSVLFDEKLPVMLDFCVISGNLLEFFVIHGEGPVLLVEDLFGRSGSEEKCNVEFH